MTLDMIIILEGGEYENVRSVYVKSSLPMQTMHCVFL